MACREAVRLMSCFAETGMLDLIGYVGTVSMIMSEAHAVDSHTASTALAATILFSLGLEPEQGNDR
jgi:hypothetical protein